MTRTSNNPRDRAVANEASENIALMCDAHGCPNLWSSDFGSGRLCGAHFGADPHHWPRITQEQLDASADRAFRQQQAQARPRTARQDVPRLRAELQRFARLRLTAAEQPKAWAHRLVARARTGERLTPAQRDMVIGALGPTAFDYVVGTTQAQLEEARSFHEPLPMPPAIPMPAQHFDDRDIPVDAYDDAP